MNVGIFAYLLFLVEMARWVILDCVEMQEMCFRCPKKWEGPQTAAKLCPPLKIALLGDFKSHSQLINSIIIL